MGYISNQMSMVFKILFVYLLAVSISSTFAAFPESVDGQALPSLAPMLEKTTPAVVNIATTGRVVVRDPFFDDPFFRRFFDAPQRQRERRTNGLGSGVIIDSSKGYVITNSHVIDKAEEISVTLSDGQQYIAEVIGKDPGADIAVIKIDAENLTQIRLGNSDDLRQGDFVVAIGNPFGLGQTVTDGIVSALGRSGLGIESYEDFIQTNAEINPGNSGGALVNLRGELIGINTAIYGRTGNIGIGFAIPVNMAMQITEQLIEFGEVKRGHLGFSAQDLSPDLAEAFGISRQKGVVVARVVADSPAEKAGMKIGDVIIEVAGQEVQSSAQVRNKVGLLRIGESVKIRVLRNGKPRVLTAVVEDKVSQTINGDQLSPRLAGAVFAEVNEETSRGSISGIEVISVEDEAQSSGLRKGDIILSMNKQRVKNIRDMKAAIEKSRDSILLNIQRDSRGLFLLIQ